MDLRDFESKETDPTQRGSGPGRRSDLAAAERRKPWLSSFGKLRSLHSETIRINRIIDQEFGQIEDEDWK